MNDREIASELVRVAKTLTADDTDVVRRQLWRITNNAELVLSRAKSDLEDAVRDMEALLRAEKDYKDMYNEIDKECDRIRTWVWDIERMENRSA